MKRSDVTGIVNGGEGNLTAVAGGVCVGTVTPEEAAELVGEIRIDPDETTDQQQGSNPI